MARIKSSRVVIEGEVRPATIHFEDGVVVEIGSGSADSDFGDLVVMPGLVDSHVHVNEPGRTEWEGFATATNAAAAGGATTIVDMPLNSIPPTVDLDALEAKRRAAEGKISVDVALWGGLIPGSQESLGALVGAGVCGFKCFLVDSGVPEFPPMDLGDLTRALTALAPPAAPLLVHAEDPAMLRPFEGDSRSYSRYLATRPAAAEVKAVQALSNLAANASASIHVLHVSSGEAAETIGAAPANLSGETCPHYLTFAADDIPDGATQFKCAPPIREAAQREALWDGLRLGSLAMVVSDHSPAPADLKALDSGDFEAGWGGIASLQLRLPATWTEAASRGFGPVQIAEWLSAGPARLAGLENRKGSIAVGKDADFTTWDPDGVVAVRGSELEHRHPVTPYEGMRLRGSVAATIVRGGVVYDGHSLIGGRGRMLERG